ncbi:MAG: ArsC family reductase [Pseudomonadota bacterium]
MATVYGIKNCDTVKKALAWLDDHGITYQFHDFRKNGLDEQLLREWVKELGWEALLNRRGTTWRRLPEPDRENLDEARAIRLMLAQPSVIKRPVLDVGTSRHLGFGVTDYERLFGR